MIWQKLLRQWQKLEKSKASVLNDYELKAYKGYLEDLQDAKIGEVAYKEYLESRKKATLASDLYKELGL
ncbi:hypothetical protein RLQ69_001038 [Campylobacter jejuni]|uniref:Uncharacterized protein n=1 Tax=Campylobacter jejuni TaxID=197 RepID=A0A690V558_CAMJU|nr:hypothetical protein [Campylobacter jejuni]EAJ5193240.1 hypothetical protein [Campylobacter jejuni]EAK0572636.1 hypothetical protein [Campylobacter jejuni]EDP7701860.1 hypothetical protein [Campylobacter jejuni]EDP8233957.1 hypothetical protein [Campylobacter jejuni]EFV4332500.1 hypothetical protein [Campylobacter jejuni]